MVDAVAPTEAVPVLSAAGQRMVAVGTLIAPALAASNANATAILALTTRIAALEGKPAPIVKFSATVTLGALIAGTREWTLIVPGVRAGDLLATEPNADLPSGVAVAYLRAPAADTVELALVAGVAVTASTPITFTIAALRG